jgi:signal transduction histidine kinase
VIQLLNDRACQLLNLPDNGWQYKSLWDFINVEPMKSALKEVIDDPSKKLVKEVDLSVSGMASFYSVSSQEVLTPQKNEKLGVVTVLHNITLERELDRMKDDFLHSITHDLRNPMTSIRGFLKFLIDGVAGPITPQQHKMLETIDRASSRLLNLINDILDVAKMESGRKALQLVATDLKLLSQRVIEVAEGQAMRKNVKLLLEAPENLPTINTDLELIERVLANLVGNALKFTPEQGSITISLQDTGEIMQVTVADTGEGIPADYIGKIFDKYQQVAGQHKGGTGLGLTICRYIVESHNGKIWAESTVGAGSKFIFTLPKNLKQEVLKTGEHA